MPDVQRMLEALECSVKPIEVENCSECDYSCSRSEWIEIQRNLVTDILEFLQNQMPLPPVSKKGRYFTLPRCGNCSASFATGTKPRFCPNCGRAVLWE